MSLLQDLAQFTRRLMLLDDQVQSNAEEIKLLRQDIKELTEFTYKVASAVKHHSVKIDGKHENLVQRYENLILKLKVELNGVESRLRDSHSSLNQIEPTTNGGQKRLLGDGAKGQS